MTTPAPSRIRPSGVPAAICIAVAASFLLLDVLGASISVDDGYSFPFWGTIARVLAALALLIGFALAAFDRSTGAVCAPRAARAGLLVFGAGSAAGTPLTAVTADALTVRGVVLLLIQVVAVAGLVVAAASARRDRLARMTLVALAVEQVVWTLLSGVPIFVTNAAASAIFPLFPLLLLAFALVLATGGAARAR